MAATDSDKSSKVDIQQRTLRVLATTQVFSSVGVGSTIAAGSLLVASISKSESLAGLAQTFNVLGAAAMAIPLSRLTARGGRRLALSLGYLIACVGALCAIYGGSHRILFFMLAGTFMLGASTASNYQARFAAIDLAEDSTRAHDLSFVVWASTIGAVLGPNLMAPVGKIAPRFGLPELTGPYILAFIMLLIGSVNLWTRLRPDPYLLSVQRLHAETGEVYERLKPRVVLTHIRATPHALLGLLAIAIGHVAMVSVMVMTPVHMAHVDVSLKIIGLVISVHVAGMWAFSPLVGRLTDTIGRIRVIQIGVVMLLLSGVIAGTAYPSDSTQLGIGLFLLGLGWSCTLIAGSTLLSESLAPAIRASAQGTTDTIMNLSAAIGGALAGVIIGTLGYGYLCLLACIPVALLGILSTRQAVAA
ncbi:MAG: MFS transporter [Actinobacteria bacterium]|uniref:Unannotated protein n=1 Tax=freshwater metagenome TaxID=449393 RepID=A0A6J5Z104_9ZZZZ|nr:MFS transporter [Actinomycetota bacterium]